MARGVRDRGRRAVLARAAAGMIVAAVLATACGGGATKKPGDDPVLRGPTTTAGARSGDGY